MKNLSEGKKMWFSVMAIFIFYAIIFIMFEDYDRKAFEPLNEISDWHLLIFTIVIMTILGLLLIRYAKRMDERIKNEQEMKQTLMRRQLTQNISHELKTPVASILGYTETIVSNPDMPQETKNRFIERTQLQAQRLATLLNDLSILNRVDYAPQVISMQRVNVSQVVADIVQDVDIAIKTKHMTLNNYLPEDIIINGNESLIYSIFSNLIDNSLNYAGENAIIDIHAYEEEENSWLFKFCDNGEGVAEEHLQHLFERFYRIDNSRSRSMGGTGLGLAIVKNAVLQHGGSISVTNRKEGGLEFTFTLKKQ